MVKIYCVEIGQHKLHYKATDLSLVDQNEYHNISNQYEYLGKGSNRIKNVWKFTHLRRIFYSSWPKKGGTPTTSKKRGQTHLQYEFSHLNFFLFDPFPYEYLKE